jgi:hypothetical protein
MVWGLLEAAFEHDVLEGVFMIFLAGLVEIIHVELDGEGGTCRTKEV